MDKDARAGVPVANCGQCGCRIEEDESYCPVCGERILLPEETGEGEEKMQYNAIKAAMNELPDSRGRRKHGLVVGAALLAVALLVAWHVMG